MYRGRMHTIVPAVMAVEGVLNGALVTAAEIGKYVEAWNGRPIPILHPEHNGQFVSANAPDILERAAGTVFNAALDGERLKGEFWLDEQRFDELGASELLAAIARGDIVEVSTGYFADHVLEAGEFKGKPYTTVHRNIRPDHVALLPGQVGACSVADGCGVPRVNKADGIERKTLAGALSAFMRALKLSPTDCSCEVETMKAADIVALATALVANGKLAKVDANFDIAELEKMSDTTRKAIGAALKALEKAAKNAEGGEGGEGEEEGGDAMKANGRRAKPATNGSPITLEAIGALIDSKLSSGIAAHVEAATKRASVTSRILANTTNKLTAADLAVMSVEALERYEQTIRPADYSAQGGYSPAAPPHGEVVTPFVNRAFLAAPAKKA